MNALCWKFFRTWVRLPPPPPKPNLTKAKDILEPALLRALLFVCILKRTMPSISIWGKRHRALRRFCLFATISSPLSGTLPELLSITDVVI